MPSAISFQALPQDDPRQRQPDIRLAKEALGWQPLVDLDQGLDKAIAYFRERLTPAG